MFSSVVVKTRRHSDSNAFVGEKNFSVIKMHGTTIKKLTFV